MPGEVAAPEGFGDLDPHRGAGTGSAHHAWNSQIPRKTMGCGWQSILETMATTLGRISEPVHLAWTLYKLLKFIFKLKKIYISPSSYFYISILPQILTGWAEIFVPVMRHSETFLSKIPGARQRRCLTPFLTFQTGLAKLSLRLCQQRRNWGFLGIQARIWPRFSQFLLGLYRFNRD